MQDRDKFRLLIRRHYGLPMIARELVEGLDDILAPIQHYYERLAAVVEQAGPGVSHYSDAIPSSWEVSRRVVSFSVRPRHDPGGQSEEVLYVDANIGFAYGYESLGLPPEAHDRKTLACCCAVESGVGEHLVHMPVRILPPMADEHELGVAAERFVADAIDFLEEHESFIVRYVHDGIPSEA